MGERTPDDVGPPADGAPRVTSEGDTAAPLSSSQLEFVVASKSEVLDDDELTPIISIEAIPGRPSEERPPVRVLGNYEILQSIGSGGMAEVFLARHAGPMGFEKILVLKCIHPHLANQKNFVDMFLDEARLAARINDPRVVQIHELGEANGTYFMAMEYLAGESLSTVLKASIRGGPSLPSHLAARIVADAAAGLHTAHELRDTKGRPLEVVHRDVSHGNIVVLYSGAVKLLDFGVAKARDSLQTTSAGERKGKYGYMSPEQVRGEAIDRRSDVFSLGVVLWEALTKQRLFAADSELETVRRVIDGVVPAASSLARDVPPELDAIVAKALAKDRTKRYQTSEDLSQALEGWLRATGAAATMTDVANFMKSAFAERIEQRSKLLRVGNLGDGADEPPLAEIQSRSSTDELHTELVQLRASRRRFRILLAALGASIVLAAAYYVGRTTSDDDHARLAARTVEPAMVAVASPPTDVRATGQQTPPQKSEPTLAESLFARATQAIEAGRVAAPPGDNALELLLDAERQAPGNPRAKAIRETAVATLLADAAQLWSAGKVDSARTVYADVLLFDAGHALAKQRSRAPKKVAASSRAASSDEVTWLVTQIDLAIIERRLVTPPGRNALEYLQRLRKVDPGNQLVRRLGSEVATALKAEATQNPAASGELLASAKVATGETKSSPAPAVAAEKVRDPLLAARWVKTGNSKLAVGNLGDARNAFQRAVAADSTSHAALAGLAEVSYNESDYTRAVLAAKRALASSPSSSPYRMLLAKSYYKLLRYDDAIEQWRKVLELDPKNTAAQKNIEMAERRKGER